MQASFPYCIVNKGRLGSRKGLRSSKLIQFLSNFLCCVFLRLSYNVDFGLLMYADDHQTYVKGKDMCTVVAKLQESATLSNYSVSQKFVPLLYKSAFFKSVFDLVSKSF